MHKDCKLQNSNYSCVAKPNINPLHFQRAYFVHSLTNLGDFCSFGCTMWSATKYFYLHAMEQCLKIYKSLTLSAYDRLVYPNMLKTQVI